MWLVLFEFDGTLTHSTHTDALYASVMSKALGVQQIDTRWSRYPHASDSSISRTLLERHTGKFTLQGQRRLHDRYIDALARDDTPIVPVPGASRALEYAVGQGWAVAFATGNWDEAGRIKLRHAGLGTDHLPLAGSTEIEARHDIMADGVRRAESAFGVRCF